MNQYKYTLFLTIVCLFFHFDALAGVEFQNNTDVDEFSNIMIEKHGFTQKEMTEIFNKAKYLETPGKSSDKPAEALDWATYSSRMINEVRIKQGIRYYKKHRTHLRRVESIYGVPDYIVAGIMGIETNYGMFPLKYRAVDALASLAFFYPRRGEYFKNELKSLLIYSKKYKTDPFSYLSSYAGAIGMPQFMPSNVLAYAVDASLNGKADIINNHKDAIYSVGNFLKAHKWQKGKPIVTEVRLKGHEYKPFVRSNPCAKEAMTTVENLKKAGVIFPIKAAGKSKASLFALGTPDGDKYFAGFENLCVIYKYNPSLRYAMVVNSLGARLDKEKMKPTNAKKKK